MIIRIDWSIFVFSLLFVLSQCVENLNPKPKAVVNELSSPIRFESPAAGQELFSALQIHGDSILLGARDAVYNLSATTLDPKFTIPWKALAQTIEECSMKGKSESECHNYIRVVNPLRNGRLLVCGTHAFSPLCREFEYLPSEDRFAERQEFGGQGIAPYDPHHNSTYTYLPDSNEIFVGTVSDFGGDDPLIYRKKLPRGDSLRTPKDLRVIESPDFVGSFAYKEHIYFWYREKAADSVDNNQERQTYSRVARVCQNDHGGPSPTHDRWSSFLKARLNCSIPAETPFYFNELQSISGPIDDGHGDAIVFGVFQTSRSSVLMSAVCSFRMSQVLSVFDHGRFKTQKNPSSVWAASQRFTQAERPGKCVADSRRLSDISFIVKNPLMYDLVSGTTDQPLLVEGPISSHAELTAIHALKNQVKSVRGQGHAIIFVGRADGTIGKLVDTQLNQTSVLVSNIRVFNQPVKAIRSHGNDLLVATNDRIVRIPQQHCSQQTSCSACVRLRDPHCAWEVERKRCEFRNDWSTGSFIQNILTGASEQCPAQVLRSGPSGNNYQVDEGLRDDENQPGTIILGHLEATDGEQSATASTTTLIAIIVTLACALLVGFLIGYRISKYRALNRLKSGHSPVGSSNGSDCDSYGRARLTRHDSLMFSRATHIEHPAYASAPVSRGGADAVSLVFNTMHHNPHMPMMNSISNGASGLTTPRHERNLMLSSAGGATLPRDYRVKKVYL